MKRALILMVLVIVATIYNPVNAQDGYLCGDVNLDQAVNLLDALYLIDNIYSQGPEPPIMMLADVNNDGALNLLDILAFLEIIYLENGDFYCGFPHEDYQTDCLPGKDFDDDTMYVVVEGYDIHVHHDNAFYDCCLGYWTINSYDLNYITVYQYDSIPECDCLCYFNLKSTIHVQLGGEYVITLIGLGGDTVGVDTAHIEIFPVDHQESQDGCLSYAKDDPTDTVFFEVVGNDLYTYHRNAYYNCGLAYVVDYEIYDFTIRAAESDTGEPADCICYFNLESVLYDLADGEYDVTLVNVYGQEIAWETIVIDNEHGLTGYQQSDCFDYPTGTIVYTYDNGTLTLEHHDAFYNCVAEMLMQFEQAGDTLRFFERNISEEAVYCLCYFELDATADGIAPGDYIVEVWSQEYPDMPLILLDRRILQLE